MKNRREKPEKKTGTVSFKRTEPRGRKREARGYLRRGGANGGDGGGGAGEAARGGARLGEERGFGLMCLEGGAWVFILGRGGFCLG